MKKKTLKNISSTIAFLLAVVFVVRFGGAALLRLYVEFGVGNCRKIPILCMVPEEKIIVPGQINREYLARLIPYDFPKMKLSVPKGFTVTQQRITKDYYKRRNIRYEDAAIYLLYEEPGFFTGLFPRLKKQGINNNYDFIRRTMYAETKKINNLTDTFFIIMKGIFIPDLGDQKNVKMAQFKMEDRKGFINYNLGEKENYFDCNIIREEGDFFKIYIKDEGARLNLNLVLAVISTLDKK